MTRKGARTVASRSVRARPRDASPTPAGLEDVLGYHLHLAYRVHLQRFAAVGALHNVRASQFAILNFLYCNPSARQADLASALRKKHSNVVTAVDELQHRGLIARMRDPGDRRSRILRLTPAGEKLTVELMRRYADVNRDLRKRLGAQDADRLLELLRRFSQIGA